MKKKHTTVKVVLVTLLVFVLLTWILPAAYFQGSYIEQGRVQMGIFDLFSYPTTAISYFGHIALFILVVGGFYGVLSKISAYRLLLDKLAESFKKHGKLTISIIMILLAVITSICGLQIGLIIFFPLLIALILLMGYDKIVAALTVVGSTMIGVAGSTFAYSNTNVIMSTLSLKITSNMLVKVIILVLGLALLIFNTIRYINKQAKLMKVEVKASKTPKAAASKSTKKVETKKTASTKTAASKTKTTAKSTKTTKSTKTKKTTVAAAKVDEVKMISNSKVDALIPSKGTKKQKIWPLVVILFIVFIIMILSFISWTGAFNNKVFEDITTNVTGFKIFNFALFGKLLGTVNPFGNWSLVELITVIMLTTMLLMIIYKVKFNEGLEAFVEGAKKAIEPAVLVILIYTCLVVVTYHPFQLVIYKFLFGLTKGFNVVTSTIAAILASVFNADPLYTFQSVLPYLASLVSKKATLAIAGVVYQSMYGVTMLIAPTSVVLMTVLSYLGVSYKEWFKNIWKLLLELLIVMLIIFTILVLV